MRRCCLPREPKRCPDTAGDPLRWLPDAAKCTSLNPPPLPLLPEDGRALGTFGVSAIGTTNLSNDSVMKNMRKQIVFIQTGVQ